MINALYCGKFKKIYAIVLLVWKLFLGRVKLLHAFVTTSISRKKSKNVNISSTILRHCYTQKNIERDPIINKAAFSTKTGLGGR